jgi:hypothetical protein
LTVWAIRAAVGTRCANLAVPTGLRPGSVGASAPGDGMPRAAGGMLRPRCA